jgi:hypothetical protein
MPPITAPAINPPASPGPNPRASAGAGATTAVAASVAAAATINATFFMVHSFFRFLRTRQRAPVAKVAGFLSWLRLYVKFNFHEQPFRSRKGFPDGRSDSEPPAIDGARYRQSNSFRC